jgi:hypothetical protein
MSQRQSKQSQDERSSDDEGVYSDAPAEKKAKTEEEPEEYEDELSQAMSSAAFWSALE